MILNSPTISGSLTVTGNTTLSGSINVVGGLTGTSSFATTAISSSYSATSTSSSYALASTSASYALSSTSSSYALASTSSSYGLNALTSSNSMTASSADTLYVRNNATVLGSITAQTLVVQTVTSSVLFSTGSNKLGSLLSNTQELTGSVGITGSLSVVTTGTEFQVNAGGVNIGNALTDNHIISGSVTINPNGLFVSSSGFVGINNISPTVALDVTGAGKFSGALTGTTATFSGNVGVGANPNQSGIGSSNRVLTVKAVSSGGEALLELIGLGNNATDNIAKINFMNQAATTALASIEAIRGSSDTVGELSFKTSNTTRLTISSLGAVGIAVTPITDPYTATGGGWKTVQFGKGGILGAYGTDNESMSGFNTYVTTDGSNKAIISSIGGTAIRYYEDRITFNTLSTSGTAQTQSERMRINSAGNVGIGTTSVSTGYTGGTGSVTIQNARALVFNNASDTFNTSNAGGGITYFTDNNLYVDAKDSTSNMIFRVNTTQERMRINSSGHLLVGSASNNGRIEISTRQDFYQDLLYLTGTQLYFGVTYSFQIVTSTQDFRIVQGSERFRISANGSIGAGGSTTNIYNASDIRLKQNISTITSGLDKVAALNPVKFNWADGFEPNEANKTLLGFIAQEVQEVVPEAIESFGGKVNLNGTEITDTLRVNEKFLIPVLVKAIQELSVKNSRLEEILQRNNIQ